MQEIQGCKVFSATKAKERELLGETITDWIRSNPDKIVVDKVVTQSSDQAFHCIAITLFYRFDANAPKQETGKQRLTFTREFSEHDR